MTTPNDLNKLQAQQTDPQLDALLDRAVSAGSPPADPDLSQRILDQTLPMLGQEPVIAKIGPTVLRIAAAVAIVVGAGLAAFVLTDDPAITSDPAKPSDPGGQFAQVESGLQDIENAIEPGNTPIDQQLDALSLRVELVSSESAWSSIDTDTNSLMDQAATGYELDQFSQDAAYLWADDSALF